MKAKPKPLQYGNRARRIPARLTAIAKRIEQVDTELKLVPHDIEWIIKSRGNSDLHRRLVEREIKRLGQYRHALGSQELALIDRQQELQRQGFN